MEVTVWYKLRDAVTVNLKISSLLPKRYTVVIVDWC